MDFGQVVATHVYLDDLADHGGRRLHQYLGTAPPAARRFNRWSRWATAG
jgi:hypothetical protein